MDIKVDLILWPTSHRLCFTHAVQRAMRDQKIEIEVDVHHNEAPVSYYCIDCANKNEPEGVPLEGYIQ